MRFISIVIVLSVLLGVGVVFCYAPASDAILMSEVKTLTFVRGQKTTGRRNSPISQLECSASPSRSYEPDVVQCENRGGDGVDFQWRCEADLDQAVKFGKIQVSCEGYSYPDDPYILRGSCGLVYTLESTGHGNSYESPYSSPSYYSSSTTSPGNSTVWWIFMMGFIGLVTYIVYLSCWRPVPADGYRAAHDRGGYGGAPPPYYGGAPPPGPPSGPPPPYTPDGASAPPYQGSYPSNYPPSVANPAQARPGFWTGLTAGGLLGYLLRPRYRPWYGGGGFGYGGGYRYGGYGGGMRTGGTGGTRSAAGYGGTTRR